jgi:hypothetical protein
MELSQNSFQCKEFDGENDFVGVRRSENPILSLFLVICSVVLVVQ